MWFWSAMLLGCQEIGFRPIGPTGPPPAQIAVRETFVQAPLPSVDLLFVIDGTASMEQELEALAADVPMLIDTLDAIGLDWQIGVVGATRSGPHPGWLLGAPFVLTPVDDDPATRFAERLPVGDAVDEAGLAAAVLALSLSAAGSANAGFRRPGAALQVVFVSDADDRSDPWLADPVAAAIDALAAEDLPDRPARASALVGDLPNGCVSIRGAALPGARYHAVAAATGGRTQSICAIDFGALLQDLAEDSVVLPTRFALDATPVADTLRVEIDDAPARDGWQVELSPPTLVFDAPPPAGARVDVRYVVHEDVGP